MFKHPKRPLDLLAILVALAGCGALLFCGGALAGKPDKPGKPGGGEEPMDNPALAFPSGNSLYLVTADGSAKERIVTLS